MDKFPEILLCFLMKIIDRNPSRESRIIWVGNRHIRAGFCRQLVQFARPNSLGHLFIDLLNYEIHVQEFLVETKAQEVEAVCDLLAIEILKHPVSFGDLMNW